MTKAATKKDRNEMFSLVERVRKGECFALNSGKPGLLRAAREFHNEGLIVLAEISGVAGLVLRVERAF